MINYQAPNPYPEKKSFLSSLFSSSSPSTSKSIGKAVLPAQQRKPQILDRYDLTAFASKNNLSIETGFIFTHDKASLETIHITPMSQVKKPIRDHYFVVKFNGNNMQFADGIQHYSQDAKNLNCSVIGFDYRNVGNSEKEPRQFQDLVTDGIAQVQRLLDIGANPKHITLDGLSLGGAVATMVASHFHQKGIRVYLWNDRSFSTLPKAAVGLLQIDTTSFSGECTQLSGESTTSTVLSSTGWNVDVANAYLSIPDEYKGYMVVAKKSDKSVGDGVIAHFASLHKGVCKTEKNNKSITGFKMFAPENSYFADHGGHNMPRTALVSKDKRFTTGQDAFESFVNKHRM